MTVTIEPPLLEFRKLWGRSRRPPCSKPVFIWGDKRGLIAKLRFQGVDPVVAMLRMAPCVWRYYMVIAYYHRNGCWLGMLRGLAGRRARGKWIWVGFAPNPPISGLRGWVKEFLTRNALTGFDVIVCNARPVIEMILRAVRGGRGPDGICPLGRRNWRKLLIIIPGGTGGEPVTPAL